MCFGIESSTAALVLFVQNKEIAIQPHQKGIEDLANSEILFKSRKQTSQNAHFIALIFVFVIYFLFISIYLFALWSIVFTLHQDVGCSVIIDLLFDLFS